MAAKMPKGFSFSKLDRAERGQAEIYIQQGEAWIGEIKIYTPPLHYYGYHLMGRKGPRRTRVAGIPTSAYYFERADVDLELDGKTYKKEFLDTDYFDARDATAAAKAWVAETLTAHLAAKHNPRRAKRNGEQKIGQDWKDAASRLLARSTGKTMDDFHYRAYLRAILQGVTPVTHKDGIPYIGALEARQDLIDEYGKGPAKKNPRKALRNSGDYPKYLGAFREVKYMPGSAGLQEVWTQVYEGDENAEAFLRRLKEDEAKAKAERDAIYREALERHKSQKNPRKARRNGALGTAAVALVSFAGGMYAQKTDFFGSSRKAKASVAPVRMDDARWHAENIAGRMNSLRRMNGRLYVVFKSKFGGYVAEVLTADEMLTDRRMVPSDPSPSNDSAFRTQAEAKAAAERDAGLAPKAKAAKRKR
jgi:hypothetical protein